MQSVIQIATTDLFEPSDISLQNQYTCTEQAFLQKKRKVTIQLPVSVRMSFSEGFKRLTLFATRVVLCTCWAPLPCTFCICTDTHISTIGTLTTDTGAANTAVATSTTTCEALIAATAATPANTAANRVRRGHRTDYGWNKLSIVVRKELLVCLKGSVATSINSNMGNLRSINQSVI